MKTSSAKAKGRRLQQKAAQLIREALGLEEDDIQSRPMGSNGEDLMLSPAARRAFPFSIECKKRASVAVLSHYKQAETNSRGHTPMLIVEEDRGQPFVVIKLADFLKAISK